MRMTSTSRNCGALGHQGIDQGRWRAAAGLDPYPIPGADRVECFRGTHALAPRPSFQLIPGCLRGSLGTDASALPNRSQNLPLRRGLRFLRTSCYPALCKGAPL